MNLKYCTPILFAAILISNLSFAQETTVTTSPVKILIAGALELGGDEVAEVFFTNGESQSVKAGQGGALYAGIRYILPSNRALSIDGTFGFKYVTTAADNVHIRLTRIPIHLMINYAIIKDFNLSAGVASHQSIKFSADGIGDDISFDPAIGPRFEFSYKGIGLSMTFLNYTSPDKVLYKANSIGLGYTYAFGI